jgi:putative oxidoreductase
VRHHGFPHSSLYKVTSEQAPRNLLIELIGGLLIALGVLTSFAAFIASGEMAFAYFTQHFPRGFWPIQNGGELAVLNCFLFLYIAANGAGMWGVWRLRRDL